MKVLKVADDYFIEDENCLTVNVDLSNISDNVEDYFGAFAESVFPDYFGYNWNAFDECIQDLSWYENTNIIFRIRKFERILLMPIANANYAIESISSACKQRQDHHLCFLLEIKDEFFGEIKDIFDRINVL